MGLGGALIQEMKDGQLDVVVAGPEGEKGLMLIEAPLVWVGPQGDRPDVEEEALALILMPPPCSFGRQLLFSF